MSADFTSALFLALRHPSTALAPWRRLTAGQPAAARPVVSSTAENRYARLVGASAAVSSRSALHALIDVLSVLVPPGGNVLVDEHAYPIGFWAAATVSLKGGQVITYRHHQAEHARSLCRRGRVSVVLTDGWCGSCNRPAPLSDLDQIASGHGARLVVDDSLAVGVLGPRSHAGFGCGGAGTAGWLGHPSRRLVTVSSLAKAFGAPLAMISGPAKVVTAVRHNGPARMHGSGPTAADAAALAVAMSLPAALLQRRRDALWRNTMWVRCAVSQHGAVPIGLPFPVVLVDGLTDPLLAARSLRHSGVGSLVVRRRCQPAAPSALALLVRSDHRPADLAALNTALAATEPASSRLVGLRP